MREGESTQCQKKRKKRVEKFLAEVPEEEHNFNPFLLETCPSLDAAFARRRAVGPRAGLVLHNRHEQINHDDDSLRSHLRSTDDRYKCIPAGYGPPGPLSTEHHQVGLVNFEGLVTAINETQPADNGLVGGRGKHVPVRWRLGEI